MLIYLLTFASGKQYVGQTVRALQTRMTGHRAAVAGGSQLAVHCAWRRHGDPKVEVLRVCQTVEELHEAETAEITSRGTMSPGGYNISRGGDTAPSKNPAVAAKISAKAKGRRHTDTSKARIGDSSRELWESGEYRAKVSAGIKAAITDEHRAAMSRRAAKVWEDRRQAGWTMPEAQREKIAGYERTSDTRAKMSASAKARVRVPFTDEHKAKIAARVKADWENPEAVSRRALAIREGHARRKAAIERGEVQPYQRTPEHEAAIRAAKARKKQAAESHS